MKKYLALILALVMLVSFAACSKAPVSESMTVKIISVTNKNAIVSDERNPNRILLVGLENFKKEPPKENEIYVVNYEGGIREIYPSRFEKITSIELLSGNPVEIGFQTVSLKPTENLKKGISLKLPDGWTSKVEINENADGKTIGMIKIHPKNTKGNIVISSGEMLGVCGTGLKEEKIELAGMNALKGTYDDKTEWDFICSADTENPFYVLNSSDGWFESFESDIDYILASLSFPEY